MFVKQLIGLPPTSWIFNVFMLKVPFELLFRLIISEKPYNSFFVFIDEKHLEMNNEFFLILQRDQLVILVMVD